MKGDSTFMDRKINSAGVSVVPNWIYRVNGIPVNTPASYFMVINKLVLKLIRRSKRSKIADMTLKEENKFGGLTSRLTIKVQ